MRMPSVPVAYFRPQSELLIGQHVISAAAVKQSGLEIISTGYMVIDGGAPTTVSYISNAAPIPADKNEISHVHGHGRRNAGHESHLYGLRAAALNAPSPRP